MFLTYRNNYGNVTFMNILDGDIIKVWRFGEATIDENPHETGRVIDVEYVDDSTIIVVDFGVDEPGRIPLVDGNLPKYCVHIPER